MNFSISELVKENENGLLFSNGTQLADQFMVKYINIVKIEKVKIILN